MARVKVRRLGSRELPHIVEARYAIERFLAAFAARRRTALDLQRLQQSLVDMQTEIDSGAGSMPIGTFTTVLLSYDMPSWPRTEARNRTKLASDG